ADSSRHDAGALALTEKRVSLARALGDASVAGLGLLLEDVAHRRHGLAVRLAHRDVEPFRRHAVLERLTGIEAIDRLVDVVDAVLGGAARSAPETESQRKDKHRQNALHSYLRGDGPDFERAAVSGRFA